MLLIAGSNRENVTTGTGVGQTSSTQRLVVCVFGAFLAVLSPVLAADVASPSASPRAQAPERAPNLPDYSNLSHHELTEVGARWDELGDAERRALLKEVKMRMATQNGGDGALQIRAQRRYGRIVRRSDGRVLRIETKVVQVRPLSPRAAGERSFGVGFERRHGPATTARQGPTAQKSQESSAGAPALRVNDPN